MPTSDSAQAIPATSVDDGLPVKLREHPTARNAAIAADRIPRGGLVCTSTALSVVLLPDYKGKRCDYCHRSASASSHLRKCTGCAAYWYCGTGCQTKAWATHHRHICKRHARWVASWDYARLPQHERLDAEMLSQIACGSARIPKDLIDTMSSLLPSKHPLPTLPILTPSSPAVDIDIAGIHQRFGNNNFILHSHLDSYAHGAYPRTSRLFNHSCVPNAVPRYVLAAEAPPIMEVVALRDIKPGEEVCIPYTDPALDIESRTRGLEGQGGFTCACKLCTWQRRVMPSVARPDQETLAAHRSALLEFAHCRFEDPPLVQDLERDYDQIPTELYPFLHESVLPSYTEAFGEAAGDTEQADKALDVGLTVLAMYTLIYPPNYPQTAMHTLELAKVAWNAYIKRDNVHYMRAAVWCLRTARRMFETFGREGDEGGPLAEIEQLQVLMEAEVTSEA
ncbi:unnamed protein product [Peniophora sp. CBMAI 1063]|nr:unnamed protein product [Peniophora sp. CBMAI 1063]